MPSEAVRRAALKATETGTLDNLLQFVCGVVFGWKGCEGEHETRINGEDENGDAVAVRGGPGAPRDSEKGAGDAYDYDNKFPRDMLPSPDWAQDDEDWNEAMKYRAYECGEENGALPGDGSSTAIRREEGQDEGAETTSASRSGTIRGSTPGTLLSPSPQLQERNIAPSPPVTEPSIDATPSPNTPSRGSITKGKKRGFDSDEDRGAKRQRRDEGELRRSQDGENDRVGSPEAQAPRTGQPTTTSLEANAPQMSEELSRNRQSGEQIESLPSVPSQKCLKEAVQQPQKHSKENPMDPGAAE